MAINFDYISLYPSLQDNKKITLLYKVGDLVKVYPRDHTELIGTVIGHQKTDPAYPIIEYVINGVIKSNAFCTSFIRPLSKEEKRNYKIDIII